MIKTIDVECNAANPNLPLKPMFAFINSPSSIRVRNVPKRIGDWCIRKVYFTAVYPDSTVKTAECVLTGGVWVGTIEGSTTAGTLAQGYSIIADGVDENGNDVTGYVLGKGDVVIMKADGVPEPEPTTIFVKLQDDGTGAEDGDIYPTENGYMIQQNGEPHLLGTPFDQITAYVDTQVSSKAEISDVEDLSNSLSNYYTKSETSSNVELDAKFETKADLSAIPTKTSELSNDSGFITEATLNNFYTKSDTSSAIEIQDALDQKQPIGNYLTAETEPAFAALSGNFLTAHQSLADYYTKSETSSAIEIENGLLTKADQNSLSNYYPSSGGLINGDISWKSPFYTGGIKGYLSSSATQGIIVLYDTQENKDIYITPSNFQGVSSNIVYWPTKSGTFVVDADLSALHQDYVYDNVGNSISANREVHVINEISGLVFYDSIQLGYIDYLDENDIWQNTNHTVKISANAPESEYAWHIFVSDFKYDEYITINAEGDFNVGESINWSSGNYYYVRNCVFTRVDGLVKKTTLEHLATQEWVLAQLSALEARIAALEGN